MHTTKGALGFLFYCLFFITIGILSTFKAQANLRENKKWWPYGITAGIAFGLITFFTVGLITS